MLTCVFCNNEELPIKEADVTQNVSQSCVALTVVVDGKTITNSVFLMYIPTSCTFLN